MENQTKIQVNDLKFGRDVQEFDSLPTPTGETTVMIFSQNDIEKYKSLYGNPEITISPFQIGKRTYRNFRVEAWSEDQKKHAQGVVKQLQSWGTTN